MVSIVQLRVFLAGRVRVEADRVVLDEGRLVGRQGRLVFAYLVAERGRPVPRDELAEALWGSAPPASWDKALTVIASKLRGALTDVGVEGGAALTSAFGCYRLDLPEGSWVDVIVAADAADAAEQALALGHLEEARAGAGSAVGLLRQPFLPGEDRDPARVAFGHGGSGGRSAVSAAGDSLRVVYVHSGRLVADTGVGATPTAVAVGEGAYWVANAEGHTVSRVDPGTNAVLADDSGRQRPERDHDRCRSRLGGQQPRRHGLANRPRHEHGRPEDRRRGTSRSGSPTRPARSGSRTPVTTRLRRSTPTAASPPRRLRSPPPNSRSARAR